MCYPNYPKQLRILIIGNGFDLAHGLPTSYRDFLDYSCIVTRAYEVYPNNQKKLEEKLKDDLDKWYRSKTLKMNISDESSKEFFIKLNKFLCKNVWYEYFKNILGIGMVSKEAVLPIGKNWIDFESEIKTIVKYIDENNIDLDEVFNIMTIVNNESSAKVSNRIKCFFKTSSKKMFEGITTIDDLRKVLYKDLNNITEALELYLQYVIDKSSIEPKDYIKALNADIILSFNYTHTYSRLYDVNREKEVYYIHGECGKNNLVLGIDEYYSELERDKNTNFVMFKKFFQRILKKVEPRYIGLIENRISNSGRNVELNIIGHSMDITDKDILARYMSKERCRINVYAKDDVSIGGLIANSIRIIGEDLLIKKNYDLNYRINFKVVP